LCQIEPARAGGPAAAGPPQPAAAAGRARLQQPRRSPLRHAQVPLRGVQRSFDRLWTDPL